MASATGFKIQVMLNKFSYEYTHLDMDDYSETDLSLVVEFFPRILDH